MFVSRNKIIHFIVRQEKNLIIFTKQSLAGYLSLLRLHTICGVKRHLWLVLKQGVVICFSRWTIWLIKLIILGDLCDVYIMARGQTTGSWYFDQIDDGPNPDQRVKPMIYKPMQGSPGLCKYYIGQQIVLWSWWGIWCSLGQEILCFTPNLSLCMYFWVPICIHLPLGLIIG